MYEKYIKNLTAFKFGNTLLYQTFTKCGSNQYAHFDILTCQMYLQVMEGPLILFGYFHT